MTHFLLQKRRNLLLILIYLVLIILQMGLNTNKAAAAVRTAVTNTAVSATATPTTAPVEVKMAPTMTPMPAGPQLTVDVSQTSHLISPTIYGMAQTPADMLADLAIPLHRWGGNANERYNWQLGNAWNAARDWYYQNGSYGHTPDEGSISDRFLQTNLEQNVASLLTIPMVGWVASNTTGCAFPLPDGTCGDANGASCNRPGEVANRPSYSVAAPPQFMADWLTHLNDESLAVPFVSFGNEPLIWGTTHYDVHPQCTTYDEYLDRYLSYAGALRELAPNSQFIGPNSCCWWFYWNSMSENVDKNSHDGLDFLPWFLREMAAHEAETGVRLLDVLGVHYYPEGLYNNDASGDTAVHRLRSTRSLWDPTYRDESWIDEPIRLIPRMQELIETYYPGTEFGIGEWNFGADGTMNGAVTIADVLGIFGREDLYYATYWTHPEANSPGYFAFKMYSNFDDANGRFGGTQPLSIPLYPENPNEVGFYAARDRATGTLYLMLINKQPDQPYETTINLTNFGPAATAVRYQYDQTHPEDIVVMETAVSNNFNIELPPYSISLLVIPEATQ